ncbi:hypothetical protein ACFL23_02385, partial [Patescibacteria group bacterium]
IKKKALLIIFLISIILFFKGISWMNDKNIKEESQIIYNQTLTEINKKMDSLEASLIYGDIEKAEKITKEIDILMKTGISQEDEQSAQKYNELKTNLADYNKKINKITEISNPKQLDATLNKSAKSEKIVLDDNNLISFDFSNNIIYKFDFTKKSSEQWDVYENNKTILSKFSFFSKMKDENELLGYSKEENKIHKFNIKNKTILEIKKGLLSGETADVKYYADNVYILDTKNNQIYVYRNAGRQQWTKEANIELTNGISMAIDGNIFVLKEDGKILKFFKGKKENFSLQDINPTISAPTKIYTNADYKYLYILDQPNRRILIFEKECSDSKCNLIAQYTSPQFNELQDFTVDEKNNLMYVLNNGTIYKINLTVP